MSASADSVLLIRADGSAEYLSSELVKSVGTVADARSDAELLREIHPEDRRGVIATYRAAFEADPGNHFSVTHRIRTSSGSWIWVEARIVNRVGVEGIDALVVTARDVTERERAVRRLRRRLAAEDLVARTGRRFVDVTTEEVGGAFDAMLAELGEYARACSANQAGTRTQNARSAAAVAANG